MAQDHRVTSNEMHPMTTHEPTKQQIITALDTLPAGCPQEVADFVALLQTRYMPRQPLHTLVVLNGLWSSESTDETDIAEVRTEIWGSFGKRDW